MRLVVVSNRVTVPSNGGVQAGGMTVGIEGALNNHGGVWLGWSGQLCKDGSWRRRHEMADGVDYVTLDLPAASFHGYYSGFANQVLWPLFHGRPDLVSYDDGNYDCYLRINGGFADELMPLLDLDDVIWVHDYHLIPLAHALRGRGVRNRIGFFLHTPFGEPGDLMRLPMRDALAEFLNAYDLIGVQTQGDLRALRGFMAAQTWVSERHPMRRPAPPQAGVFPIGIDTDRFEAMATGEIADRRLAAAFDKLGATAQPIIAVDRLDYSKGIAERLCAFDTFLTLHPEFAGRVGLIQLAPISRSGIPAYQAEAERVRRAYTGLRATHDWGAVPPAQLLTEGVDRRSIASAYQRSRVALVTPLRDGMNLVAKEYVAAQDEGDPGVLVLSRYAGAGEELGDGALMVDPRDQAEVVEALHRALTMDRWERQERWSAMIATVRANDVSAWSRRFLDALGRVERPVEPITAPADPVPAWREAPTPRIETPAALSRPAAQANWPNSSG
jgi:trehalose 6-phosphate synthase